MSYDISLKDPVTHETLELSEPHMMRGGMYAVGGTTELWLNITYNYARYYYSVFEDDGIRHIYGMSGADSIPVLEAMIKQIEAANKDANGEWLGTEGDTSDYWTATAANAISPLYKLIAMAKMRPDGIWDGD